MNFKEQLEGQLMNDHQKQRVFIEIYDTEEGQQLKNMNLRDEQSYATDNDHADQNKLDTQPNENIQKNNEDIAKFQTAVNQDRYDKSIFGSKMVQTHQKLVTQHSANNERRIRINFVDSEGNKDQSLKSPTLFSQGNKQIGSDREFVTQEDNEEHKEIRQLTNMQQSKKITMTRFQEEENDKENQIYKKIQQRLMNFFKNYTYTGKTVYLEKRGVHTTLNDKSDGYFDNQQQIAFIYQIISLIKKLKQKIDQSFLSKIPVISSQSKISLTIQILIILFNSFFFLLLSIMIVFDNVLIGQDLFIYKGTLIVWAIDIAIKLNTSTYKNSNILTNRKDIFLTYFKKKFICDFIPSLLLMILLLDNQTEKQFLINILGTKKLIQVLTFAKVYNLNQEVDELQKKLCMMMKRYYIMKLANLILKLFIIGHIIACTWYIIATIETTFLGVETTWYNDSIAEDQTWWKVYLLSMYWALTLMTTGSNVATTVLQTFFTTFIMLFTTIIIGYMLNTTGLILQEIDASEENKRNDLNIINEYMREKNISINLQSRVNIYLEYYYQKNYQKQTNDIKNVLQKISTELRCLLQKEYFYQILTKIDFLSKNYTPQTLLNLSVQCEEVVYYPNQIIFEEKDFRDAALLVIVEGQVEIFQQVGLNKKEQKTICYLKSGQILGQINFFTGMARSAGAKSKGFTKLAKISRESFLSVVSENEKDIQTFYQMKDNILLYENYEEMNIRCSACQSYKHLQGTCPLVHLNKQTVMEKVRISNLMKQERRILKRQKQYKKHGFQTLNEIQMKLKEFQQNQQENGFFDESDDYDDDDDDEYDDFSSDSNQDSNQNLSLTEGQQGIYSLDKIKAPNIHCQQEYIGRSAKNSYPNTEKFYDEGFIQQSSASPPQSQVLSYYSEQVSPNLQQQNNEVQSKRSRQQSLKQQVYQSQNMIDIPIENNIQAHFLEGKNKKINIQNSTPNQLYSKPQSQRQSRDSRKITAKQPQNSIYQFESDSSEDRCTIKLKPILQQNQENKKRQTQFKKSRQTRIIDQQQASVGNLRQLNQISQSQLQKRIINDEDESDQIQEEKEKLLWFFDKQKDYDYYFNHGNQRIRISQYNQYQVKREQKQLLNFIAKQLFFFKTKGRQSTQVKSKRLLMKKTQSKNSNILLD